MNHVHADTKDGWEPWEEAVSARACLNPILLAFETMLHHLCTISGFAQKSPRSLENLSIHLCPGNPDPSLNVQLRCSLIHETSPPSPPDLMSPTPRRCDLSYSYGMRVAHQLGGFGGIGMGAS